MSRPKSPSRWPQPVKEGLGLLRDLYLEHEQSRLGAWPQAYFYSARARARVIRINGLIDSRLGRWVLRFLDRASRAEAGRLLMEMGRWQEAENLLEQRVSEHSGDAVGHHDLARVYFQNGKLRQARKSLAQALALGYFHPNPLLLRLFSFLGLSHRLPGGIRRAAKAQVPFYQALGFHSLALACLSVDSSPEGCWIRTLSLVAVGRVQQAQVSVLSTLGVSPSNPYAWIALGFLAAWKGKPREAERAFQAALRRQPENVLAKEQLYLLWAHARDTRGRRDALAYIEEHETDSAHLALGRAILCASLGQWPAALKALQSASSVLEGLAILELSGHAQCQLGQARSGCRRLEEFQAQVETSRLPLLYRAQRLNAAKRRLTAHQPRRLPQTSP